MGLFCKNLIPDLINFRHEWLSCSHDPTTKTKILQIGLIRIFKIVFFMKTTKLISWGNAFCVIGSPKSTSTGLFNFHVQEAEMLR